MFSVEHKSETYISAGTYGNPKPRRICKQKSVNFGTMFLSRSILAGFTSTY
jgi:hypothetical protein